MKSAPNPRPQEGIVYGFRKGTRDYPTGIVGPFGTFAEAREAATQVRDYGEKTGVIVHVTPEAFEQARADMRNGVMPWGW